VEPVEFEVLIKAVEINDPQEAFDLKDLIENRLEATNINDIKDAAEVEEIREDLNKDRLI